MKHQTYHAPRRCYACSWSIAECHNFNCHNNPDICTNVNFKPHLVQQAECAGGCEQIVVTDPNGIAYQNVITFLIKLCLINFQV